MIQRQIQTENLAKINKMQDDAKDIVELIVGGKPLVTTRATLMKYKKSALAAMFSGRFELTMHKGRIFIDRDGESFSQLISFLRTGRMPAFEDEIQEQGFWEEMQYF